MVLIQKRVVCALQVMEEFLPYMEKFKLTSERRREREIDRWISAATTVMWTLYLRFTGQYVEENGWMEDCLLLHRT